MEASVTGSTLSPMSPCARLSVALHIDYPQAEITVVLV